MLTPFMSCLIEGVGYKLTRSGQQTTEVHFEIRALPWPDPSQPASCQVKLTELEHVTMDHPIYGADPLQAAELSVKLVASVVSLRKP